MSKLRIVNDQKRRKQIDRAWFLIISIETQKNVNNMLKSEGYEFAKDFMRKCYIINRGEAWTGLSFENYQECVNLVYTKGFSLKKEYNLNNVLSKIEECA